MVLGGGGGGRERGTTKMEQERRSIKEKWNKKRSKDPFVGRKAPSERIDVYLLFLNGRLGLSPKKLSFFFQPRDCTPTQKHTKTHKTHIKAMRLFWFYLKKERGKYIYSAEN